MRRSGASASFRSGIDVPTHRDLKSELLIDARIGDFAAFHIDVHELDDMIATHGVGVELRRSVACPCTRIETGGARVGCPHCGGLRFVYPAHLREDTIALVLNRDPRRTFKPAGEVVTGQAHATFPLGIVPTQGDIILPAREIHVVHETFWRLTQEVDVTVVRERFQTGDQHAPRLGARPERLLYDDDEAELVAVYWIRPGERPVDSKLIQARIGAEITLEGRNLAWARNLGPPAGTCYTVRYNARAAYMVVGSEPVFRSEGSGDGFPYRCPVIRLDRWDERIVL